MDITELTNYRIRVVNFYFANLQFDCQLVAVT